MPSWLGRGLIKLLADVCSTLNSGGIADIARCRRRAAPDSCTAANRSLRPRGRAASLGIACLGGAATDVGPRANDAVSHGRCRTSALVRENPALRRHDVITGRHTMLMKPASSVMGKHAARDLLRLARRLTGICGRMFLSNTSFGTACTISAFSDAVRRRFTIQNILRDHAILATSKIPLFAISRPVLHPSCSRAKCGCDNGAYRVLGDRN
jgi:hypothetical protein